jgi:hypothetical protein
LDILNCRRNRHGKKRPEVRGEVNWVKDNKKTVSTRVPAEDDGGEQADVRYADRDEVLVAGRRIAERDAELLRRLAE